MQFNVLCVDDDETLLGVVRDELTKHFSVETASTLGDTLKKLSEKEFDCVLLDVNLPDATGTQGLEKIKKLSSSIEVVMLTAERDPKLIVKAVRLGAADYIVKPFDIEEIIFSLKKIAGGIKTKRRLEALVANTGEADTCGRLLLGKSPVIKELIEQATKLKGHGANVLISGESGTGKELLARFIHGLDDPSRSRPFITVNCAAIPDNLLESELFGHERGSFTGAHMRKIGKFELADEGDIFLDEIATLKPEMQAKILRAIQEKEITRIGSNSPVKTNFRVIAATNEDLPTLVERGLFRLDLYYRLKVVELVMPPLRARKSDIAELAAFFLQKYSHGGRTKTISTEAMEIIKKYPWHGNVRELENVIHGAAILSSGEIIAPSDLPKTLHAPKDATRHEVQPEIDVNAGGYDRHMKIAERAFIERALEKCSNDRTLTAKTIGISRAALYVKMKSLGIK